MIYFQEFSVPNSRQSRPVPDIYRPTVQHGNEAPLRLVLFPIEDIPFVVSFTITCQGNGSWQRKVPKCHGKFPVYASDFYFSVFVQGLVT